MKHCFTLFGALALMGFTSFNLNAQEAKGKKIKVALPVQRQVDDVVECAGRTNATASVTIVPRVTGFVTEIPFKEGSLVKAGDVLFKVDPRPYEAQFKVAETQLRVARNQLTAAKSQLTVVEAKLRYDKVVNDRYRELALKQPGAVSARELDQHQANEEQSRANVVVAQANIDTAVANLAVAEANLELPRLNLEWTAVRSPVDGQVGRYLLTVGNLVIQDQTQLTTVVSKGPMQVHFDLDEPAYVRIRRAAVDGKFKVLIKLAGEVDYSHEGMIDFVGDQANPDKNTVSVRAVFNNPKSAKGGQLLMPGMSVRLQLAAGPRAALLINFKSVLNAGDSKFVFVYNDTRRERRNIKLGEMQPDGLIVIEEGLRKEDRILLNDAYAPMVVQAELLEVVAMPMKTIEK